MRPDTMPRMAEPSSTSHAPAIVMRGVQRDVDDLTTDPDQPNRVRLLDGVDLTVTAGGLTHIVGPSGSGKTTLIRLINRLDEPTAGTIDVLGRPVTQWAPRDLRRRVAMVFQEPTLIGMTVRGNLEAALSLSGRVDDAERRIDEAMKLAELDTALLDRTADRLSVGQKQRATLARALVTEPDVLLLDEPTAGLDPRTAEAMLDSLSALRDKRDLTIVMVTHHHDEAARLGGAVVVLIDGRVAARGDAATLLNDPPTGPVRDFLRGQHTRKTSGDTP
ncbi:MAG: ATP-binding cassette domain-containing protein [Phycisphaera sp.]|nr:ATP-binding cassette domain-containing protein [Phycisphaera sp.]